MCARVGAKYMYYNCLYIIFNTQLGRLDPKLFYDFFIIVNNFYNHQI